MNAGKDMCIASYVLFIAGAQKMTPASEEDCEMVGKKKQLTSGPRVS